jgi:hypothetical protein
MGSKRSENAWIVSFENKYEKLVKYSKRIQNTKLALFLYSPSEPISGKYACNSSPRA